MSRCFVWSMWVVVGLLLLQGCAELQSLQAAMAPRPSPVSSAVSAQVAQVLAYVRYTDELRTSGADSDAALRQKVDEMNQAVQERQGVVERLKLAHLLSIPGTPFQDSARSVRLLDTVRSDYAGTIGPITDLADWMSGNIDYTQQLELELRNYKARFVRERARRSGLERDKETLGQENAELRSTINALTDIELKIDESTLVP